MKSKQELQLRLEGNLRLRDELCQRVGRIRNVLERMLSENPVFTKPGLLNLWHGEHVGYRRDLNGNFWFSSNDEEFCGEYHLRFSTGSFEYYWGEPPVELSDREIRVRGTVSGFDPVDFDLVPVSRIKTLDPDSLRELQEKITEVEFLLKTIGLIPDGEVDSGEKAKSRRHRVVSGE